MMRDEMVLQLLERVLRRVGVLQQAEIGLGNRAPLRHGLEIEDLVPVLAAVQDHFDLLRQLVGLHQRENLEELIARPEAAGKNHQRFREVSEPELSHEKIMKFELQAVGYE